MIILASASPRRRELLQQIDCEFRVMVGDALEENRQDLAPKELVLHNARLKAMAVSAKAGELPVLGADTVVSLGGRIYGKPKDAEAAAKTLRTLSGRAHEVATGIVFLWKERIFSAVETTRVVFARLTEEDIARYVMSGEPLDKAGAYGIQGRGAAFIERISGSYSNVVGLPLHRVVVLAGKAGINLYGKHGEGSAGG